MSPPLHVAPSAPVEETGEPEGGAGWVDVSPCGGTLVLFLSGVVEHEVLPCVGAEHRVAITAWCQ